MSGGHILRKLIHYLKREKNNVKFKCYSIMGVPIDPDMEFVTPRNT